MSSTDSEQSISQLLVAVVQPDDVHRLLKELGARGHRATRLDAVGGFLREGNVVLLVGASEAQVPDVRDAIRQTCRTRVEMMAVMPHGDPISLASLPMAVEVGGAVVFSLPVEQVYRLSEATPLNNHLRGLSSHATLSH